MHKGLIPCLTLIMVVACAPPPARSTIAVATAMPTATNVAAPATTSVPPTVPFIKTAETFVPPSTAECPVTPLVKDSAPSDSNANPVRDVYWYINADRTIWATGPSPTNDGRADWADKMYWVRPRGTQLIITGRRLDGDAPPLGVSMPCCYPTGFQIAGISFPTAGCWEVIAKAGVNELRFVTYLKP